MPNPVKRNRGSVRSFFFVYASAVSLLTNFLLFLVSGLGQELIYYKQSIVALTITLDVGLSAFSWPLMS